MRIGCTLWFLLAACAGPDPDTVVTVHTRDRADRPVAGVIVHGHDATGTKVDEATTGTGGVAVLDVPAGGSITTHEANPSEPAELVDHRFYTVLEVAPGDDILVRIPRGDEPRRDLAVTAPALPAGATAFRASASCAESIAGSTGQAAVLRVDLRCPERGPLVLTASGSAGEIAYLYVPDADLRQTALTVSGTWTVPTHSYTVDVTGFATAGGEAAVSRAALIDGYALHWTDVALTTSSSTASAVVMHPGVGDGVVHRLSTYDGDLCDHRARTYTRSRPGDTDRFAVDLGELMAPIIDVQPGDHELRWTGGGGGLGIRASVVAAVGSGDVVGRSRTWTVVAPGGTTAIRFPDDVGFVWPTGSGDRLTSAGVSDIASTHWGSYAELRQRHAEDPARIAGEFVTRMTSIQREYAYLGCSSAP